MVTGLIHRFCELVYQASAAMKPAKNVKYSKRALTRAAKFNLDDRKWHQCHAIQLQCTSWREMQVHQGSARATKYMYYLAYFAPSGESRTFCFPNKCSSQQFHTTGNRSVDEQLSTLQLCVRPKCDENAAELCAIPSVLPYPPIIGSEPGGRGGNWHLGESSSPTLLFYCLSACW